MGDSKDNRTFRPPGSVPGSPTPRGTGTPGRGPGATPAARPGSAPAPGAPPPRATGTPPSSSGRVVHDERGNAVWHFLKETSRIAIESTSRLLRKLEIPELKVEETKDEELRIESDRDPGGGYDPYSSSSNDKRGKR